jgi:hypothetical protein
MPWWAPLGALVLAVPGVLAGLAVPAVVEAGTTDTVVVAERGVWILVAAVLLAVTAVAAGSRSRQVRPPGVGSTG